MQNQRTYLSHTGSTAASQSSMSDTNGKGIGPDKVLEVRVDVNNILVHPVLDVALENSSNQTRRQVQSTGSLGNVGNRMEERNSPQDNWQLHNGDILSGERVEVFSGDGDVTGTEIIVRREIDPLELLLSSRRTYSAVRETSWEFGTIHQGVHLCSEQGVYCVRICVSTCSMHCQRKA